MKSEGWQNFGGVGNNPWHPNAPLYPLAHDDFNTFIANVVEQAPGYLTQLYEDFAPSKPTDQTHRVLVGKQESLTDDLLRILNDLKHPPRRRRHPRHRPRQRLAHQIDGTLHVGPRAQAETDRSGARRVSAVWL